MFTCQFVCFYFYCNFSFYLFPPSPDIMLQMGYAQDEIQDSLVNQKYDEIMATYLLLDYRNSEVCRRVNKNVLCVFWITFLELFRNKFRFDKLYLFYMEAPRFNNGIRCCKLSLKRSLPQKKQQMNHSTYESEMIDSCAGVSDIT